MSAETNVIFTFVADGNDTFAINQWIVKKDDISVYFGTSPTVAQTPSSYSVSSITPTGYSLTFTSAPPADTNVTIVRNTQLSNPNNYPSSAKFTSSEINTRQDINYLRFVDDNFYLNNATLRYDYTEFAPDGSISENDLIIPIVPTPTSGHKTIAKDETGGWVAVDIDGSGGPTGTEVLEDLASTSPTSQGALLVGTDRNGGSTVADDLDDLFNTANSTSDGGANYVNAWVTKSLIFPATASVSLQTVATKVAALGNNTTGSSNDGALLISMYDYTPGSPGGALVTLRQFLARLVNVDATGEEPGYINYVSVWDQSSLASVSVGEAIVNLVGTPSSGSPNIGAGYINYWNGSAVTTTKAQIDSLRARVKGESIGDFLPGRYATNPSVGSWLIGYTDGGIYSIGFTGSLPLHYYRGAQYEDLFKFLLETYMGYTSTQANTSWNDPNFQVSFASGTSPDPTSEVRLGNEVPGVNLWRYA